VHPEKFGPLSLAVLIEPVGIYHPSAVIALTIDDGLE
jgi:hypothetical protein